MTEQTPSAAVSAANTCERCKWWDRFCSDEPCPNSYWGTCTNRQAMALVEPVDDEWPIIGRDFGCRFWQARESKEEK